MKQHEFLIDYAIERGNMISVHDGKEWRLELCMSKDPVLETIEIINGRCLIYINKTESIQICTVVIDNVDNVDQSIIDYTTCEYMDDFFEAWTIHRTL